MICDYLLIISSFFCSRWW